MFSRQQSRSSSQLLTAHLHESLLHGTRQRFTDFRNCFAGKTSGPQKIGDLDPQHRRKMRLQGKTLHKQSAHCG